MIRPEDAERHMRAHFEQVSLEEFKHRYEHDVDLKTELSQLVPTDRSRQAVLLTQREAAPLQLHAYLASALTGLGDRQRQSLFDVSDLVAAVCNELDIVVYEPRKSTDPILHPNVSPIEVYRRDREIVLGSDLIIHIADYASTGAGEELDFAQAALIPIVLLSHGNTVISRMVLGIPGLTLMIQYSDLDDLRVELRQRLMEIRPIVEERKLAFSNFNTNIVGNKVRLLRQEYGLTREELVSSSNGLLDIDRIREIEENTDKVANPSLLELRALSVFLKTTVADLAEPDLEERMRIMLHEWLDGNTEARYGMSRSDRNKILRRILLRVIDDLERE